MLNMNTGITNLDDCLLVLSSIVLTQCKVVFRATVNGIWRARNHVSFQNELISWRTTCTFIYSRVQLAGNASNGSSSLAIGDFEILKKFSISINQPKPVLCTKIIWSLPSSEWMKVNVGGASGGVPVKVACGGIFRDHLRNHVGSFACNLGNVNALFTELMRVILAIE